jgi:HEPN domain-containing protein
MSEEKFQHEADRWMLQAGADLEAATISARGGSHEWACFQAQQAAEKALKALWYSGRHDPWGHSLVRLVNEHPAATIRNLLVSALLEHASTLDQYYLPTRYPNGLPDLTPHEVYTGRQAEVAITTARGIIEKVTEIRTRQG